jgi:hypothetical protein
MQVREIEQFRQPTAEERAAAVAPGEGGRGGLWPPSAAAVGSTAAGWLPALDGAAGSSSRHHRRDNVVQASLPASHIACSPRCSSLNRSLVYLWTDCLTACLPASLPACLHTCMMGCTHQSTCRRAHLRSGWRGCM